MTAPDMEQLARLLAALPPVPQGWVAAAEELPRVRRSLDHLLARAEADAELRAQLAADLDSALTEAGIAPTQRVISEVRERMRSL